MNVKAKAETYYFSKEYKALPVKMRARLIMIARTLLKVQREGAVMVAGGLYCEKQGCMSL
jgi:hypothetical protein